MTPAVLIIGGTQFVGPHVVRRLSTLGCPVTVFHRGQTASSLPSGVREILGDRGGLSGFAEELKRLAPTVVVDMIPSTEQDARTVMAVFKNLARRIVAVSSMDVYRAYNRLRRVEPGPPDPVPLTEDAPLREKLYPYRHVANSQSDPRFDYEKILVERVVMSDPGLPGTVLRLPAVYGPGDPQHRFFPYLKRMDDGRPAILLERARAQWRFTRGYVEDVAVAIVLAVLDERAAGRVYNVGETQPPTEAQWVKAIGQAAGWSGEVLVMPRDQLPGHLASDYDWEQHWVGATSRIRRELGYLEAVPIREALRQTVAWERTNPPHDIDPKMFDYAAEDKVLSGLGVHPRPQ